MKKRGVCGAIGLLVVIAIAPVLRAQHVETIDVRVVTLPVLARDGRGRPVTDLKANEITVGEGQKTYRVESLTRYVSPPPPRAELPRARLILLQGDRPQVAAAAAAEPRYMVLVVDVETDPLTERKRVTDALKQFVATELDPSFQVAVLLFDGEVRQLAPLTYDRQAVAAALDRVHTERKARPRVAPGTLMQQLLGNLALCENLEPPELNHCLRQTAQEYADEVTANAHAFLDGMEGVVGYLDGLEGHKSVLVVGGNVSIDPSLEVGEAIRALYGISGEMATEIAGIQQSLRGEEALRPRLDDLWARAFRNRVSISFLDRTPAPSDVSARFGRQFEPGFRPMSTAHQSAQQDLNEIAAATGGSFVASTRVAEGLRQSMALLESAYELTIHLPDSEPLTPRRLRRISIRSTRPGVRILHQRGFEGARAEEEASAALGGGIEAGAPVQQEIDGASIDVIPLRFVLDPADLGYEEGAGDAAARFTIHFRLRTPDGALLTDAYRVFTHTYPLDRWRKRDIEPPALVAYADVPPGQYLAEAVVTVPRLGKRGILRRAFTAAAPAVAEPAVAEAHVPPPDPDIAPGAAAATPDLPPPPRQRAVEPDLAYRPSIAFARHFLGVVTGVVDVSVLVGREIASVDLLLDGHPAGSMAGEPWVLPVSLGDAPSPRELVAVARDASGRAIGHARQWLNLPRPWTELEVVLSDTGDGALLGQIALENVGGEKPRQVVVTLDGRPVSVSNSPTFRLSNVDLSTIHLLRVEAEFEKAGPVSRDVVIGGRYVQEASAELSSIALEMRRRGELTATDVQIHAGGKPVPVVALERGPADVIVVIDPRAIRMLPGFRAAGDRKVLPQNMDTLLTPAESGMRLRLLWPVAQGESDAGRIGYRLFPSTDPDAISSGGLLAHVAGATFPDGKGPVRLADAVAVAGPMAIERGRRRAVLLVHGGSPSEGEYTAAAARAYLRQLGVPLIVWRTGNPTRAMLNDWGSVESVTTSGGLRNAWINLLQRLDLQRIAWLEGMHLPQTLQVMGQEVELAGATRR